MYADRAETIVLGKAARDAVERTGRRVVALAVTLLSSRLFVHDIDPREDRISSQKDDEWNRKLLEILAEGRLEDVSQLAREFSAQANGDQRMKALWWLAALMGEHNRYTGTVYDYQPVWGTGAALVGLVPAERASGDLEFDEESVETYQGDRGVLEGPGEERREEPSARPAVTRPSAPPAKVLAEAAPRPVGAYPHARREGGLLFLSGIGPRTPGTDEIPGGPVRGPDGSPREYDVDAQTRAVIRNVRAVLEAAGSSLESVVDVTVFLIDMERDFGAFNRVWAEVFGPIGPTRTTLAVTALPTPIAVEMKVLARVGAETAPA
jgi:2-aminomuconate deaminase